MKNVKKMSLNKMCMMLNDKERMFANVMTDGIENEDRTAEYNNCFNLPCVHFFM